jgi:hypothetical protein
MRLVFEKIKVSAPPSRDFVNGIAPLDASGVVISGDWRVGVKVRPQYITLDPSRITLFARGSQA